MKQTVIIHFNTRREADAYAIQLKLSGDWDITLSPYGTKKWEVHAEEK